jgi:hypothetical protein
MIAGLAQGITSSSGFATDAMGNLVAGMVKASEWDSLSKTIGATDAKSFVAQVQAAGLNAMTAVKQAGIGSDAPVAYWANQLTKTGGDDTISTLLNDMNNVALQMNQLGLNSATTAGKTASDSIGKLTQTLSDLLATGKYYAPYVPGGSSGGGGAVSSSDKLLTLIADTLKAILGELQKDGKQSQMGLANIVTALTKAAGGLGDTVTGKAVLR